MQKPDPDEATPEEKRRARSEPPPLPPRQEEGRIRGGSSPRPRPSDRSEIEGDDFDDREDRPRHRKSSGVDEDEPYSKLIPYRNVSALLGYYAGMIGLIVILGGIAFVLYSGVRGPGNAKVTIVITLLVVYGVGGLCALLGVVLGTLGIVHARNKPRGRGLGHALTGLILGCLEIAGLLAILVMGVIVSRH